MFYPGKLLFIFFLLLFGCEHSAEESYVEAVYPTSSELPENLLRMYVTFTRPMKTVGNLEKIRLLDAAGKEVENVFFNNAYELWDQDQRQLTLLLDPARVKTGLRVNAELGRGLKVGKTYRLLIEDLEDVNHQRMLETYTKDFVVVEADLVAPNVNNWHLNTPEAETRQALQLEFPEMLDQYSLRQRLIIVDDLEKAPAGQVYIGPHQRTWFFKPDTPWKAGAYVLLVNTRLEDPAGNNINGLFDHQIGTLKSAIEGETIRIPFTIGANSEKMEL